MLKNLKNLKTVFKTDDDNFIFWEIQREDLCRDGFLMF